MEFKMFALSMYKRSPRLYKYLQVYFALPSPRVLKRLLNAVHFDAGFNNNLLQVLKNRVKSMELLDRHCTLAFDEMKVSGGLHYEKHRELIIGFEDLGHLGRSLKYGDHAMVLMARGVRMRWKQPIAYYFTAATIPTAALKNIIKAAITHLKNINLIVVGTVCDQGPTNRTAIKQLCSELNDTPSGCHFNNNDEIIDCLFDVGHLMKNTRNAMIDNLIEFEPNKFADFKHIQEIFTLDQKKTFRSLYKLTAEHFNFQNSYTKMKVSTAARQLSYTVACELETYVSHNQLEAKAAHTAEFVHLVDQLFDSCNGSSRYPTRKSKPLRCAIAAQSGHVEFWLKVLPQIGKWKIINRTTGKDVTKQFSFIHGWQVTIRSMISIWRRLSKLGLEYLCCTVLNQDVLENLFCCVRQHGISNTNPTCHQFISALKTCILNNLALPRHIKGNCKVDEDLLLNNLSHLIRENETSHTGSSFEEASTVAMFGAPSVPDISIEEAQGLAYVSGYIVKKMKIPDCETCKRDFISEEITPLHTSVVFRDDDGKSLTYASQKFMQLVNRTNELLLQFLKTNAHKEKLETTFKTLSISNNLFQNCFSCDVHGLGMVDGFLKIVTPFLIYKYVNEINKGSESAKDSSLKKHKSKMKKLSS